MVDNFHLRILNNLKFERKDNCIPHNTFEDNRNALHAMQFNILLRTVSGE